MKLTVYSISQELKKCQSKDKVTKLSDGRGLYLHIMPFASNASWRYGYRINGKQKTLTIGKYPQISLMEAREKLFEAMRLREKGIDPAEAKQEGKKEQRRKIDHCFENVALEWYAKRSLTWSNSHAERLLKELKKDVFPSLGGKVITEITAPLVSEFIHKLQREREVGEYAQKLLQRIKSILNYAVIRGYIPVNPVLSLINVVSKPDVEHQLALKQSDLLDFFKQLHQSPANDKTKIALLLLIITFVRSGEMRTMAWEDIDFEKREWNIPKEKYKGKKRGLCVPLSDWALTMLKELKSKDNRQEGLVFYSRNDISKPISENTLSVVMWGMGYKGVATPHGFRSLATDVLNENGFRPDVIERQLGHVEQNSVRRAYHRTEYLSERREMMYWYSEWIKEYYEKAKQQFLESIVLGRKS